jgi:sulfate transport system permease protein
MNGRRLGLRVVALGYLAVILVEPLLLIVWRTFAADASGAWGALSNPETVHAFKVTLEATAIAVPLNTVFGILCGSRSCGGGSPKPRERVRRPAAGDLAGGHRARAVPALRAHRLVRLVLTSHGYQVLFALPAIVMATVFVSVPFVARGDPDAARDRGRAGAGGTRWACRRQTFWRITLPSIRWAVVYGVVLTTARCLGEYGAVAVVSGSIQGKTETATLRVQEEYENLNTAGAYGISLVLAAIAVTTLILMSIVKPREERL